jgi:hypothetical protein
MSARPFCCCLPGRRANSYRGCQKENVTFRLRSLLLRVGPEQIACYGTSHSNAPNQRALSRNDWRTAESRKADAQVLTHCQ